VAVRFFSFLFSGANFVVPFSVHVFFHDISKIGNRIKGVMRSRSASYHHRRQQEQKTTRRMFCNNNAEKCGTLCP